MEELVTARAYPLFQHGQITLCELAVLAPPISQRYALMLANLGSLAHISQCEEGQHGTIAIVDHILAVVPFVPVF